MNETDHQRAERLMLEARVEGIPAGDQWWLEAHLESCEPCGELARSTSSAIDSLRSVSVKVDPELVARTRLLVRFRTRELARQGSWLLPVWVFCALSWIMGVATAPLVWRGFEWLGHRAGLPAVVWEAGFALWWAVPALVVVLLLGAKKRQAAGQDAT